MRVPGDRHLVELAPITEDPPQDTAGAPTARLDYEPVVHASPLRLAFALCIANETASEVVLTANPYEGLTYSLSDDDDWPVEVDPPAREAKVDGVASARSSRQSYLAIDAVELAGAPVDVDAALAADGVHLAPGSSLVYQLAIDKRTGREDDNVGPLTEGDYSLSVLLPLSLLVDGRPRELILRSAEVGVRIAREE